MIQHDEIGSGKKHEEDDGILNRCGMVPIRSTRIFCGKSAGGNRAHRMVNGIKETHPKNP